GFQGMKQIGAGPGNPAAGLGGFAAGGDGPIGLEAAEMIEADEIDLLKRGPQAVDPPGVAGLLVAVPGVERIAPELAGFGKVIGRYAGDVRGSALGIDLEEIGARPNVGGVRGN